MRKIMEFANLDWGQLDKVEKEFIKIHGGDVWGNKSIEGGESRE